MNNEPEKLSERVWRLRAPNPSPMTLTGTNSYLIRNAGQVAILDPGPNIESHVQNLLAATDHQPDLIVVTHGHPDHFPAALRLHELTGVAVAAYHKAAFPHQVDLADNQTFAVGNTHLTAIFTPGHAQDHLCFYLQEEQALFTGDNILGQGTTVVAPPKGSMADYLSSLTVLKERWGDAKVIYGGHGPEITLPLAKIEEYLTHRQARQAQLVAALQKQPATIPQLVATIYRDTDRRLWSAAARQVLAYLIMLENDGSVGSNIVAEDDKAVGDQTIMNPVEASSDPVAAAELGLLGTPEKLRRYFLTQD